ncbi:Maf-like protein [Hathewaya massiliensis]|uniref:Maf-like protein n=1 Tax=Hathewaya massiliensis TaxID=1964382 RepID=UPI00115B4255|nr:Maf-like protein [Hathewaya massiliensis]
MEIILASASKRRQELLKELISEFTIVKSDFDEESIPFHGEPSKYVEEISKGKALSVYESLKNKKGKLIVACDTIVYHNGVVLGKPKDKEEAFIMLRSLSGNTHEVYSGFTVYNTTTDELIQESFSTKVRFMKLKEKEIEDYINTGEPFDKAGAYGIQSGASKFVEYIEGCYFNVVGLPLNKLYRVFREMGVIS